MADMTTPGLSVLFVGQRSLAAQRRGRFVAGSQAHPARMAPDLAAAIIGDYTQPGDLVFDPLAGIGTTLVEAVHAGRDTLGMDIEPGWVTLARANVALARSQGATGTARVVRGDATRLPAGVPTVLRGTVSLVLTSPPYGPTMHGRVDHRRGPLARFHNTYITGAARNEANLAYVGRRGLADGIAAMLAGCVTLLKPGGLIVVVSRPWRRDGHLIDIPGQVITAGIDTDLELIDCRRAVHAALRGGHLHARHTFFQLVQARKARLAGKPVSLIQHDDLAVFQPALSQGLGALNTSTTCGGAQPSRMPSATRPSRRPSASNRPSLGSELPNHTVTPAGSHCYGESPYHPGPAALGTSFPGRHHFGHGSEGCDDHHNPSPEPQPIHPGHGSTAAAIASTTATVEPVDPR